MNINKYNERREIIDDFFENSTIINEETVEHFSPSRKYKLIIEYFQNAQDAEYSKGTVIDLSSNKIITEVKRNYGIFWHSWVEHANKNEYLLCGEDYQGYTTINLTHNKTHVFFPDEAYEGMGFCWTAAYPSPNSSLLAVDGCYWACPYELVVYDFSKPDSLPYKELKRVDSLHESTGWANEDSFVITQVLEVKNLIKNRIINYQKMSKLN